MNSIHRTAAFVTLLSLGVTTFPGAQQLLTTSDPPPSRHGFGTSALGSFAAGQSFVSLGSQLQSFGFYLVGPWTATGTFQAQIFAWNGLTVTGGPLYTSNPFPSATSTGWLDFLTGGIATTIGNTYLALISIVSNTTPNDAGDYVWFLGNELQNPYASGQDYFAFFLGSPTTADLQNATWESLKTGTPDDQDFAFRATFSTVPEPTSLALSALGLTCIIALRLIRNRRHSYSSQS